MDAKTSAKKQRDHRHCDPHALIQEYVFGYGSLMKDWLTAEYLLANLTGYRRDWHATMDNTRNIAGYKYYVDSTGSRELIPYVSFLNVSSRASTAGTVTGVLKQVCAFELRGLDERERNYARIDVTRSIDVVGQGSGKLQKPHRIWTYSASSAARRRTQEMRLGKHRQTVPASYFRAFREAVAALSLEQPAWMPLCFDVDKPDNLADIKPISIAK
jgi:cation transport regulator ChaC